METFAQFEILKRGETSPKEYVLFLWFRCGSCAWNEL
jgi:hypothetical protein